ncbi:MAG TPA: hypothetical protein VFY06_13880 [Verrucomicrobiae bacterium]|nr:hypothetical protein [Verrucomicrobiae bacterium]
MTSLFLLGGVSVQATLSLRLDDGNGNSVTVLDNGPGDADPAVGSIAYTGAVGFNWYLTAAAGTSKPVSGSASAPELTLSTSDISFGAGKLDIQVSDTDFVNSPPMTFASTVSGSTLGSMAVSTWADPGNNPFGESNPITSQGPFAASNFNDSQNAVRDPGGSPYSLTLDAVISHAFGGISSCDASLSGSSVPDLPVVALAPGDTAPIGFWHNRNGQALIYSLNGGPASTQLGTWLANHYGRLFGNLNGQPNSVVAAQYLACFNMKGPKTCAQVMATALAVYATSPALAGGDMAAAYGFNVSDLGTGARSYDIGPFGSILGLSDDTPYTVAQLLQAADANCPFNAEVYKALNALFDDINQTGGIQ